MRPRSSSAAREETKVARLTRERDEALEQQKATSELLSHKPLDFRLADGTQNVLETAARLAALKSRHFPADEKGALYRFAADYGAPDIVENRERSTKFCPVPAG